MALPDPRAQIRIIAAREWGERVHRPAFWVTTLVGVLMVLGALFGPTLANRLVHPLPTAHVYDIPSARLVALYRQALHRPDARLNVVQETSRTQALTMVREDKLPGFFSLQGGRLVYTGQPDQVSTLVGSAYNQQVLARWLAPATLAASADALARHGLDVVSVPVSPSAIAKHLSIYLLGIVLYMVVLMYGVLVGTATVEEKETRHAEMLLARLAPTSLLWGKVAGIGLVAACQLGVWAVAAILAYGLSGGAGAAWHLGTLPPVDFALFVLWVAVGYLQYGTIFAGLASRATRASEINQATLPVLVPIMLGYLGTVLAMSGPSGTLARVLVVAAYVPFLAPLIGFAQLQLGGIHWWGVALDLILQGVVIVASMRYAAVLFKRHLLDYRPLRRAAQNVRLGLRRAKEG